MTVTYTNPTKIARMNAVVTAIGPTGKLKLWAADGVTLLAAFTLAATAGTVAGAGVLSFSDANGALAGILNTTASTSGRAAKASVTTSADADVIPSTLTVGVPASSAPVWAVSTLLTAGLLRTNGANVYRVTGAGTTGTGAGPTGTGSGIADGTVTWEYYCLANADLQLDSVDFNVNQSLTVNSATITHA